MICEGPTDRTVLEAVLDSYIDDYEPIAIQPPRDAADTEGRKRGTGWKGVRAWCTSEVSSNKDGWSTLLENTDLLIIQLDADVAAEPQINRAKPCPPAADSANEVRGLILQWLGLNALPGNVVLCVPSMASETWALVSLFPKNPAVVACDRQRAGGVCIECRTDIKSILRRAGRRLSPKLVVSQDGGLKNQAAGYRAVQERMTIGWPKVVASCGEAARFDTELRAATP
ncbi:MAG TPA: hypothetical protein ENG94_08035 [Actinobacteria bacterium]|nr:hypothetical protein [Actinomycetota bacterium]